jgi:hypothetical protein
VLGAADLLGSREEARPEQTCRAAVHDDLVERVFSAAVPNTTRAHRHHRTPHRRGKLDLCAVKNLNSNRIVGYSIDSRMEASLAVSALRNAVALRGRPPAAGRRQVPGPVTAQPVSSGEATAGAFAAEIGDALCGWSGAAKEAVQLGA